MIGITECRRTFFRQPVIYTILDAYKCHHRLKNRFKRRLPNTLYSELFIKRIAFEVLNLINVNNRTYYYYLTGYFRHFNKIDKYYNIYYRWTCALSKLSLLYYAYNMYLLYSLDSCLNTADSWICTVRRCTRSTGPWRPEIWKPIKY